MTFRLAASMYGVEAASVLEIAPLCAIHAVKETPNYVLGVVNYRGRAVPVIDLHARFGYPPSAYTLRNCILFLQSAEAIAGIVIDEAEGVGDFSAWSFVPISSLISHAPISDVAQQAPTLGAIDLELRQSESSLLRGLMQSEEQVVMLIDVHNVVHFPRFQSTWDATVAEMVGAASGQTADIVSSLTLTDQATIEPTPMEPSPTTEAAMPERNAFFKNANPAEKVVLLERAQNLARSNLAAEPVGVTSLAVVRLGEEVFGIDLALVQEFAEIRNLTSVPCCPPHVVGQVNLRGDLITVFSISKALGLKDSANSVDVESTGAEANRPRSAPPQGGTAPQIVVMNDPGLAAAIIVDGLIDVAHLPAQEQSHVAWSMAASQRKFVSGTLKFGARFLTLIDLAHLLAHPEMTVNEKPS